MSRYRFIIGIGLPVLTSFHPTHFFPTVVSLAPLPPAFGGRSWPGPCPPHISPARLPAAIPPIPSLPRWLRVSSKLLQRACPRPWRVHFGPRFSRHSPCQAA